MNRRQLSRLPVFFWYSGFGSPGASENWRTEEPGSSVLPFARSRFFRFSRSPVIVVVVEEEQEEEEEEVEVEVEVEVVVVVVVVVVVGVGVVVVVVVVVVVSR